MEQVPATRAITDALPPVAQKLFEPDVMPHLLRGGQCDEFRLFSDAVTGAEPEQRISLASNLLPIIASEQTLQDERDTASLLIIETIVANSYANVGTSGKGFIDAYCAAVEAIDVEADPMGAPLSMLELGEKLSGNLGKAPAFDDYIEVKGKITSAWYHLARKAGHHDFDEENWRRRADALACQIYPYAAIDDEDDATHWEWSRERPPLEGQRAELHDAFLVKARSEVSLKGYVSQYSPRFKEIATAAGIDVDAYWNTRNPDQIHKKLDALEELNPQSRNELDQYLQDYGLSCDTLTNDPALARTMIDEFAECVDAYYEKLQQNETSTTQVFERMLALAGSIPEARKPMRAARSIKQFLVSNDLIDADASWQQVHTFFTDESNHKLIQGYLETASQKHAEKIAQVEKLRIENPFPTLRAMHRGEDDLYSSDLTRDCTAYHLENGFNAWTLPYWLSDPNFNMLYIHGNGKMLAKLGMYLAIDGQQQPRLVVDSIETSKYIQDSSYALNMIERGFQEIQAWADMQGLGDVIVCTFTNSQELGMNLPIDPEQPKPDLLTVLGSFEGLDEVFHDLVLSAGDYENVQLPYMQSMRKGAEDGVNLGNELIHNQATKLERMINDAANKLTKPGNRDKLFSVAASGNWDRFLNIYLQIEAPFVHRTFNTDPAKWRELTQSVSDDNFVANLMGHRSEYYDAVSTQEPLQRLSQVIDFVCDQICYAFEEDRLLPDTYEGYSLEGRIEEIVQPLGQDILKNPYRYLNSQRGLEHIAIDLDKMIELLEIEEILQSEGREAKEVLGYIFGHGGVGDENDRGVQGGSIPLDTTLPVIDRRGLERLFGKITPNY